MILRFALLRNVGQFDNVAEGAKLPLAALSLIYAENGRGKTTLSAILRALATTSAVPVSERHRFGSQGAPRLVIDTDDGQPPAVFKDGVWNRGLPDVIVFDDDFVEANVCSGLEIASQHRKNLHDLVLGAEAVVLGRQYKALVEKVEDHNRKLREREGAIGTSLRGGLTVAEFSALKALPDVESKLIAAQQAVDAATDVQLVRAADAFEEFALPRIDIEAVEELVRRDLPGLDAAAMSQVQERLASLVGDGEDWVSSGVAHVNHRHDPDLVDRCPFCEQSLAESPSIDAYRAYFSEAYEQLKDEVSRSVSAAKETSGETAVASFQAALRKNIERKVFWAKYIVVADGSLDADAVVGDWRAASGAVLGALHVKRAAPLEPLALDESIRALVDKHEANRVLVDTANVALGENNTAIEGVRGGLASADASVLKATLDRLTVLKRRFEPDAVTLCKRYLDETQAKRVTEQQRDAKRVALDGQRKVAFPKYEEGTNKYLERFNVGFRIASMEPANTRGGATCGYSVMINNTALPVGAAGGDGAPSFRTSLSAGDRNALALAFFFASLDADKDLGSRVIVIDDPVSSLDEHRSLTTVQEVLALVGRCAQVIVLSHSKSFLGPLWTLAEKNERAAIQVARGTSGSDLRAWDVSEDLITEHDRRAVRLEEFVRKNVGEPRNIARDIRHHLEAYVRVAFPRDFPPGRLLGPFVEVCRNRVGTPNEVLGLKESAELGAILTYGNRYHHNTNSACDTEAINDSELRGFVTRTLDFCRK